MSNCELTGQAAAVAAVLAALDVHCGDRVLLQMPDGQGFTDAFVGMLELGMIPLRVDPALSASDVPALATEVGAQLVLASAERIPALADLAAEPPVLVDGPEGPWAAVLRLR